MWQMFLINSSQEMAVLKRIEFFQSKELDFNLIYKGFSMPSFINKKNATYLIIQKGIGWIRACGGGWVSQIGYDSGHDGSHDWSS